MGSKECGGRGEAASKAKTKGEGGGWRRGKDEKASETQRALAYVRDALASIRACPVWQPKMSLRPSAHLVESSSPRLSSKLPAEAYVLSLASLQNCYAALASSPTNKIHLFDAASLRNISSLDGHPGGTTFLRAVDGVGGTNRRVLMSSGKDGVVNIWDGRTNTPSAQSTSAFCVQPRFSTRNR